MSIKLEPAKDCAYDARHPPLVFDFERDPTHEFSAERILQRALDDADPNTRTVKELHDGLVQLIGAAASLVQANEEHQRRTQIVLNAISERADKLIVKAGALMRPLRQCRRAPAEPTNQA